MKRIALILCASVALWVGEVAAAQTASVAAKAATANVVGTAPAVDETTLSLGENAGASTAAKNSAGPSSLAYFLRMIVVLALVLGVIYLVYRLLKKAAGPKVAESSAIKLLASSSLGPGKTLHVIAIGSKGYLVGATDASINLVAEVEDKEYLDALVLEADTNPPDKPGSGREFGKVLASLMGSRTLGKKNSSSRSGSSSFLSGQRDRLRKF